MKFRKRERYFFRRKGLLVFGGMGLLIGLFYLFLSYYDNRSARPDGLVNGYAYLTITRLMGMIWAGSLLLYFGLSSRRKISQNIALSVSTTLILLLVLEIIAHSLIRMGAFGQVAVEFRRYHIMPDIASNKPLFWGDFSEHTGRWRTAHTNYSTLYCEGDSVFRRTNSVGASDQERTLSKSTPTRKRVIVLGDSFMEGMLVNYDERMSNRLEAVTGREHLNFAVNGSSPINYYLVYKSIAKRFEHDVVLVGLLPANDFQDYAPAEAYKLVEWPIYRPYWSGQYPNYTLKYSLNNINQSISRNKRIPGELLKTVDSVYRQLPLADRFRADVLSNSGLYRAVQSLAGRMAITSGRVTRYEQFSDAEFNHMQYSLDRLVKEAAGKKVVFLSLPIQNDIVALRNGHKNQLDGRLQQLCNQKGILFIPLVPEFLKYKGNMADLYVTCDGHWSKKGEQFVSEVLLRNPQYQALLN